MRIFFAIICFLAAGGLVILAGSAWYDILFTDIFETTFRHMPLRDTIVIFAIISVVTLAAIAFTITGIRLVKKKTTRYGTVDEDFLKQ